MFPSSISSEGINITTIEELSENGDHLVQELSNLTGDNGAKQLLKTHESCVKTLKPPLKNVDLDSKEDYEKLYKENFKTK